MYVRDRIEELLGEGVTDEYPELFALYEREREKKRVERAKLPHESETGQERQAREKLEWQAIGAIDTMFGFGYADVHRELIAAWITMFKLKASPSFDESELARHDPYNVEGDLPRLRRRGLAAAMMTPVLTISINYDSYTVGDLMERFRQAGEPGSAAYKRVDPVNAPIRMHPFTNVGMIESRDKKQLLLDVLEHEGMLQRRPGVGWVQTEKGRAYKVSYE